MKNNNKKTGTIFFCSDTHFNHANIIKYEGGARPFLSVDDMNEAIISIWNSMVSDKDTVYMLGDIFMGPLDPIDDIMPRLKGRKILIKGNHDTEARVNRMRKYLDGVYDIYNLKFENKIFVLCHHPLREWYSKENGSIHLYGHVHSNEHRNGILSEPNSYHVGIDTNYLAPISIEEVMKNVFQEKR